MKINVLLILLMLMSGYCGHTLAEDVVEPGDELLWSSRFEIIQYGNLKGDIRETDPESHRLYFNNIYLNVEGALNDKVDFMVEFQAETADLYLLGGFVTIADSLEGIGSSPDEPLSPRQLQVSALAAKHLDSITASKDDIKFERAYFDYQFNAKHGIKIGSVRIPFGLWDDYSSLRNLSAGKTDPITLGVQLRRADVGFISHGYLAQSTMKYELGIVYGEEVFSFSDSDNDKDAVFKLSNRSGDWDYGINGYLRDIGHLSDIYALGSFYRYRWSDDFTLLGEVAYLRNELEDLQTRFFYLQGNLDLGDSVAGLRWNFFIESYNSDLLKADLEDDLSYRFAGTHIQLSTGLLYAFTRNIEVGAQYISGKDEEGDEISRFTLKLDIRF